MKLAYALALVFLVAPAQSQSNDPIQSVYPDARALYLAIHQHPELSGHETQTAAKLAAKFRSAGYDVTEHVGGNGVVAVLKNGAGPTIMLRTELDALPVEEKTGLPYASTVHAKDDSGNDVPVMHACGHDLHMAAIYATGEVMARTKSNWHGTLILIGQPSEETIGGASGMIKDGLFTRFPRPDAIVALHVNNLLPAGKVGVTSGVEDANSDSIRITIFGKGGHGATPQATVDPIVIAARTILALQTIVSSEVAPGEMAVVTVGYIHAGTKNNIIPDHAEMGLTVRTFSQSVRKHILASIQRIADAEASAAGAPRAPLIERYEWTDAVYNNPALAERLEGALDAKLGKENVSVQAPHTWSEDFSSYVQAGIPGFFFDLGGADPEKLKQAEAAGIPLPSNHSPFFAPDLDPALHTAVEAELAVLRNLFAATPAELKQLTSESAR
ncbi:MAG TPA: amidohydrolase [Terriglobales bacterium]